METDTETVTAANSESVGYLATAFTGRNGMQERQMEDEQFETVGGTIIWASPLGVCRRPGP